MKNIKYFLITFFLITTLSSKATIPDWSVNSANFTNNMTITGVVNIDMNEVTTAGNLVAAFVGEECRGVCQTMFHSGVNRYVFYLMIYSNTNNESLTFKYYDAENDVVIEIINTLNFQINAVIGNAENPYVLTNQILSSEADILSFEIDGQISSSINEYLIDVVMPYGADLTNLTPEFTLSEFAMAYIGINIQESGVSSNNFLNPVIYNIHAQNGDIQSWNINVSIATDLIDLQNKKILIYPNPVCDILYIDAEEVEKIIIYNYNGLILYTQSINPENNKIDFSNFKSGLYIIEVKLQNSTIFEKIIKD
jgi:hypothetical protein